MIRLLARLIMPTLMGCALVLLYGYLYHLVRLVGDGTLALR